MPQDKGMAGKVLKDKKEKGQRTEGIITIEQKRGNNPAYRLDIKQVRRLSGGDMLDKIKVVRREE